MAFGLLTARLTNGTSVNVTIGTTSSPDAKAYVQELFRSGGMWGDDGNWYPYPSIQSITVS